MTLFNLVYAVGMLTGFILLYSALGSFWLIQFLNLFTPFYFLPLLPLLFFSLLVSDGFGLLLLLIPAGIFLYEYGEMLRPKPQPRPAGQRLRLMTWNTLYLNRNLEAAIAAIRHEQPDIIALQELGIELANGLVEALSADYPHQALFPRNTPRGYGIFSRYPLTNLTTLQVDEVQNWRQHVSVCFEQQAITLINAHPRIADIHLRRILGIPFPVGFDTEPQDLLLRCLLQQVDQVQGPLLLVGDFNISDRQPIYQEFSRRLSDAQRTVGRGLGFTFPTDLSILDYFQVPLPAWSMVPFLRLDYVFYNHAWQAHALHRGSASGSDHCYLVAELQKLKVKS